MQFFHVQGTQLTIYLKMKYNFWFPMTHFLLMKIRSKTTEYATMKKKRVNKINKIKIDLDKDIQKLEKSDKDQEDYMIMNGKKAQLKAIREKRIEGVLIRSKALWIAHGEKVTSYFCGLEKRHYISKKKNIYGQAH